MRIKLEKIIKHKFELKNKIENIRTFTKKSRKKIKIKKDQIKKSYTQPPHHNPHMSYREKEDAVTHRTTRCNDILCHQEVLHTPSI